MLDDAFAQVASAVSAALDGPFHPGTLKWPGTPTKDAGGSITAPGTPVQYDCQVQVDLATQAMREEAGYITKDVRLIVLAPGLGRAVDHAATVTVLSGPHAGNWSIESETKDTLGFAYDGRGRRAP